MSQSMGRRVVGIGRRPSRKTVAGAVSRLHALVAAGLPAAQALAVATRTPGAPGRFAAELAAAVARGSRLAAALARSGSTLGRAELALVEAGEASGTLERALALLDARLREQANLRSRALQAALYPAMLLSATVIAIAAMSLLVLPAFASLYADTGIALPRTTRAVLAFGTLLADRGLHSAGACCASLAVVVALRRRSPAFRGGVDRVVLATPLLGTLVSSSHRRRAYRTLSVLLAAGTDLDRALTLAVPTASNMAFRRRLDRVAVRVRRGTPLSTALERSGAAGNGSDVALLRIAEATGDYAAALQQAASAAGAEHDATIDRLARLAEPVAVLIMAAMVGATVLALYQPLLGSGALLLGGPVS